MNGFSIIIPVYNEEKIVVKNVKKLISYLNKFKSSYEIILCDNGSIDSTRKKCQELQKKFPKKVKFTNIDTRGVGFAFREAVLAASYNKLISVDVDLAIDLNFISKCNNLLNEYSIVVGSKTVGFQKRPLYRKVISNVFISLTRFLLDLNFTDYSIGAKGYRKSDIIDRIWYIDKGSFYVLDFIYHIKQKGKKMIEIPVSCYDRRKSRFNLLNEIFYRGTNLLSLWLRKRIMKSIAPIPI